MPAKRSMKYSDMLGTGREWSPVRNQTHNPLTAVFSCNITLSQNVSQCPCKSHLCLFRENLYRDKLFLSNEGWISCVFFDIASKVQKKRGKKVERSINNPLKILQYCILEWTVGGGKKIEVKPDEQLYWDKPSPHMLRENNLSALWRVEMKKKIHSIN